MQLPADQTRRIDRGERTTIRIPVDPRLTVIPLRPAKRGHSKPFRPTVGQRLRVHADDRSLSLLIDITAFERGELGNLTLEQANAEGYPTPDEFVQAWVERHDRQFLDNQVRYLIEQDIPDDEAMDTREEWAKVRYRDRWAGRDVWTLAVQVEHDAGRFLARAGSPTGDYCGTDEIDAGLVPDTWSIDQRWMRRASRRQLEALAENASPQERSRRARALARRVRELALHDPRLTRQIEDLVKEAERAAA